MYKPEEIIEKLKNMKEYPMIHAYTRNPEIIRINSILSIIPFYCYEICKAIALEENASRPSGLVAEVAAKKGKPGLLELANELAGKFQKKYEEDPETSIEDFLEKELR